MKTPSWVFFTSFKLCEWYQIAQSITYVWYFVYVHALHIRCFVNKFWTDQSGIRLEVMLNAGWIWEDSALALTFSQHFSSQCSLLIALKTSENQRFSGGSKKNIGKKWVKKGLHPFQSTVACHIGTSQRSMSYRNQPTYLKVSLWNSTLDWNGLKIIKFRCELHLDLRVHCLIMTQITWTSCPLLFTSLLDFWPNR